MTKNAGTRCTARRWPCVGLMLCFVLLLLPSMLSSTFAQTATRPAEGLDGWFFVPEVERPALPETIDVAFVIPIRDAITSATADIIARKVVEARAQGAQLIIFDFNTPGGEVGAAVRISNFIKHDLRDIRTVAFVNSEAISAGAMLALACNEIVMVPNGKIGDAAPIMMGGELVGVEREKIETYLRTEFRDSAVANGYSPALAEAMVSADIEVWLIQNIQTGELQHVARTEWEDRVQLPTQPADTELQWERIRVVVPQGRLLTMTTTEAARLGFLRQTVANWDEVQSLYNINELRVLGDTWSEQLVYFLSSPAITGLLLLLALFFGYVEINTPGFGVAGGLALLCLALLFGSRFLIGLATWWEIAIFVVGVGMLVIEVFVTPGFGVIGMLGLVFCVIGLLASLVGNPPDMPPIPDTNIVMKQFLDGLFAVGLGIIGAVILSIIAARFLPKTPVGGRLILAAAPSAAGYVPSTEDAAIRTIEPGRTGVIESPCRPAGKARFADELIDVMSEGEFLPVGTVVTVMRNEGNRLLVRRAQVT